MGMEVTEGTLLRGMKSERRRFLLLLVSFPLMGSSLLHSAAIDGEFEEVREVGLLCSYGT